MKKNKSNKAWVRSHITDPWVQRAQRESYRSRAAFKLKQIAEKNALFRSKMVVLDLGCAPGGWSQVARESVGSQGRVISVDLSEMAPILGVEFILGDIGEKETFEKIQASLGGILPELIVSDIAPNLSGIKMVDQARCTAIGECVLDIADDFLAPHGTVLLKTFHGEAFEFLRARMRQSFVKVRVEKPLASRDHSSEIYLLGQQKISARPG